MIIKDTVQGFSISLIDYVKGDITEKWLRENFKGLFTFTLTSLNALTVEYSKEVYDFLTEHITFTRPKKKDNEKIFIDNTKIYFTMSELRGLNALSVE